MGSVLLGFAILPSTSWDYWTSKLRDPDRVGTPQTPGNQSIRGLLANSLETAALGPDGFYDVGTGPGASEGDYIDWLTIADQAQSVTADVRRIKEHPLVPAGIPVYGYIYDVKSGRLIEVPTAHEAGRAA